jgi:hypothetical protein
MKTLTRSLIYIFIILAAASCRPGTEPLEQDEVEIREIESFSKKVMRPNFDDLLYVGGAFTTYWDLEFEGGFVNIHLYKGEKLVYTIVKKTKNDRRYKWIIPKDLLVASDYMIKIENASDLTNYGFSTKFTVNMN